MEIEVVLHLKGEQIEHFRYLLEVAKIGLDVHAQFYDVSDEKIKAGKELLVALTKAV